MEPSASTKEWILVGPASSWQIIAILSAYFLAAFVILPLIRRRAGTQNIRVAMSMHNASMALFNAALGSLLLWNMNQAGYNWTGQSVQKSTRWQQTSDAHENEIAALLHWYFLSKIFELNDIVFNVMRRRPKRFQINSQVYHHSTMVIMSWLAVKYLPGGSSAILSFINCTLHVIMYLHYIFSEARLLSRSPIFNNSVSKAVLTTCTFVSCAYF